jgi:hypothetical protein
VLIALVVFCTLISCKDPFEPNIPFDETNFLVVEGYINVGGGITTIKLTRNLMIKIK